MRLCFVPLAVLVAGWLGVAPIAAHAFDVSSCGTVIPPGEIGVVTADLVCSSAGGAFAMQANGAAVDLNGHTVTGGVFGVVGAYSGSETERKCRVFSSVPGGTIRKSIIGVGNCRLAAVSDVTLEDNRLIGVSALKVDVSNVTLRGSGQALFALWLDATNLQVLDNRGGIAVKHAVIRGMTASGNAAIHFGSDVGDGFFLHALGPVILRDSSITGNGGIGIIGTRVALRNSTVTGNDTEGAGIDLETTRLPRLDAGSTCGRSNVLGIRFGQSWRVCSDDPP